MMLADRLGISDKTVSKWERGAGLPDVSLMLPLCEALEISENELLTGEKLTDADYKKQSGGYHHESCAGKQREQKKTVSVGCMRDYHDHCGMRTHDHRILY